jgi:hypothetical protein
MYDMRESWTDARMDDFAAHVDQRFTEVDRRFDEVNHRFDRVESELSALRVETKSGFDDMHRLMLQSSVAIVVSLIALIATQL